MQFHCWSYWAVFVYVCVGVLPTYNPLVWHPHSHTLMVCGYLWQQDVWWTGEHTKRDNFYFNPTTILLVDSSVKNIYNCIKKCLVLWLIKSLNVNACGHENWRREVDIQSPHLIHTDKMKQLDVLIKVLPQPQIPDFFISVSEHLMYRLLLGCKETFNTSNMLLT